MNNLADSIIEVVPLVIAAIFWFWLWWQAISKIGYRGWARKLWIAGMCIPPVMPLTMILLLALPWPVCKQLKQAKIVQKNIDVEELRQMRQQRK